MVSTSSQPIQPHPGGQPFGTDMGYSFELILTALQGFEADFGCENPTDPGPYVPDIPMICLDTVPYV